MISIALIRHGITHSNMEGRFVGGIDEPITPQAAEQLRLLASCYPYPKADMIYRSPLTRCRQTMEEIYPNRCNTVLCGLREIEFGRYEGVLAQEAFEELGAPPIRERRTEFSFPGGESFGDCLERGIKSIDRIIKDSVSEGYSAVSVVTHSMWISTFLQHCMVSENHHTNLYCGNGMGISVLADPEEWTENQIVHFDRYIPEGALRPRAEESPYRYQR